MAITARPSRARSLVSIPDHSVCPRILAAHPLPCLAHLKVCGLSPLHRRPGGRFDDTPPSAWPANLSGYNLVDQQYAWYLYQNWTLATGPFHGARALVITINHPVPFFDDSYAVDSPNVGPYGTASACALPIWPTASCTRELGMGSVPLPKADES